MIRRRLAIGCTLLFSAALVSAQTTPAQTSTAPRAVLDQYCVSCHNQKLKTANLMLDRADSANPANSAEAWEKVIVKLRSRAMPPPGRPRPDNATYDAAAAWLETELDRAALARPNPGRPADLHRLNRAEYANAVRDLLGLEIDAASMLPPDAQAYGFDTNADALSIDPALLDRYLTAAAKIARLAIGDPTLRPAFERYTALKGNSNEQTWLWQTDRLSEEFPLGSRGGIALRSPPCSRFAKLIRMRPSPPRKRGLASPWWFAVSTDVAQFATRSRDLSDWTIPILK